MDAQELLPLQRAYHQRLNATPTTFRRYLHSEINWDTRVIGIKGARGTGKTTMLFQRILEDFPNPDDTFYASLDNLWFETHTLQELTDYLYNRGVRTLFLDEVHRYRGWEKTIKNLYDDYPELRLVYTGSSMLKMDSAKSDLSRRQRTYTLNVMSFREFLNLEDGLGIEKLSLEALLENHGNIAQDIAKATKVIPAFEKYLTYGCYPFYRESVEDFLPELAETVNTVIESDLPSVEDVQYATIHKARKLMGVISEMVPFIPNINKLIQQLETTRDTCLTLLNSLEKADLIAQLRSTVRSYKQLSRPEKIYLANTNLMHALSSHIEAGTARETFFMNQMRAVSEVEMPAKGDFLIDRKYLFEVGGADKSFVQIKDEPNSFLAVDDTEIGFAHRIPLWMFGLLY